MAINFNDEETIICFSGVQIHIELIEKTKQFLLKENKMCEFLESED